MSTRIRTYWLPWLLLTLAVVMVGFTLRPVQAQCTPGTDWPTYTVQRGESLSQIARRFGTTSAILTQANCLSNPNRIFRGQVLRVPSGSNPTATTGNPMSGVSVPFPMGDYFMQVTYQRFEGGFMVYGPSSAIWVFSDDGLVREFGSLGYGNLPLPANPTAPPSGRLNPIMGFGRVWFNFGDVRARLGYAAEPEMSFDMFFQQPSFGDFFIITLPGNRVAQISRSSTWSYTTTVPPVTVSPSPNERSVGTTFLAFENGFMIWSAESGSIWVYIGGKTGDITIYNADSYGRLPLNTRLVAPPGRYLPENGFNRVWGNFASLRQRIGWATGFERGYLSVVRSLPNGVITQFSLPDGRTVSFQSGSTWVLSEVIAPPTPFPTFTPLPTNTPGPSPTPTQTLVPSATPLGGPVINFSIAGTYQAFEGGFMIWRSDNGDILVYTAPSREVLRFPVQTYGGLSDDASRIPPPPGRDRPDIRPRFGFGKIWANIETVRQQLGYGASSEVGFTLNLTTRLDGYTPVRLSLPNGDVLEVGSDGRTWTLLGVTTFVQPAPISSVTEPLPVLTEDALPEPVMTDEPTVIPAVAATPSPGG
jgi:murein DD-endopeptidase MepM/ murein hydrolase activator NlpD